MKAVKAYSPSIKILSLILSFLVIFYLVPATVYADGLSTDFGDGAVSGAVENNISDSEYSPSATHSAGIGGVGSINLATGKLTLAIPTLTTTDSLFAFTPTLVYDSSRAGEDIASYMPKGFKLNIQETIVEREYCDENNIYHTYYVLYDADGTTHHFYQDSDDNNKFYDDSGLRLTLSFSGGNALIEDTSKNVRTYSMVTDTSWHLTSITDRYGNQLIFEFNSSYQPTKVIVKPNGLSGVEMLSFLYESGKLIAVYNGASKDSVILNYSDGNLYKVKYCYGNNNTTEQDVRDAYLDMETAANVTAYASARYGTNSAGYITDVEDLEAEKYIWYQISNEKITSISEYYNNYLGQRVSYTYGEGYTDVRSTGNDETFGTTDDIITRYIFDGYGRAISTYSMSVDGTEIYGATSGMYEDGQLKNNLKGSVVLNGVDPKDIIKSELLDSGEYFVTIQGSAETDETTGTYTQTVLLENPASLTESNANVEYIISGFGYSNSILQDDNSKFSLGVNVYYYQSTGVEDVVVSYSFDFIDIENAWQYVCGKFNCNLGDSPTYQYVRKIEVVCSYYGHPGVEDEAAYAHFKDIALTSFEVSNGYNYYYNTETGNLVKKENSQYWEAYEYNSENRVTRIYNSYNEVYSYEYTENDDGTSEYSESYSKNGLLVSKTVYSYNSYGLLTNTSYSGMVDDNASLDEQEEVYYITASYEYATDSGSKIFGALLSETDSLGYKTVYEYDENNGRLLYVTNDTTKTGYKYEYYDNGRLSSVIPITKSGSNITEGGESVEYSYYADGALNYITTESTEYSIGRDDYGNTSQIEIGDRTLATYEYYPNNGKLKKINYGNGFSEEHKYNTLEMLEEVWYTYDDGTSEQAFSYTYNHDGTLSVVTNLLEGKDTKYEYDNNGKLIVVYEKDSDEDEDDYIEVYSIDYDADGKVISQTSHIPYIYNATASEKTLTTSYTYDSNGTLSAENFEYLSANHNITYAYDNLNRIDEVIKSFGSFDFTTTYSYVIDGSNTSYRVASLNNVLVRDDGGGVDNYYKYTYDSKGNITRVVYNVNTTTNYYYDDIGQLTGESDGKTTYEYAYDSAGNITTITKTTLNENAGFVPRPYVIKDPIIPPSDSLYLTETTTFSYTDSDWGDLLTSYNGLSITYDEIGNPLTYYNGSLYTFTWEGRKLATAVNGLKTMSFAYNDEGIRTSKTVDNVKHTYHLNGSQIIAEEWEDKLLVYLYDVSGSPIGMRYRTSSYEAEIFDMFWFEKNLQGDIVAVYNSSGLKLASYTYDAWGNHTVSYSNNGSSTSVKYNPFRYRGYYYDTDLQMYYLQSRYYDSKICRFINADSYISTGYGVLGYNMFAYCNNSPICYSDPEGKALMYTCDYDEGYNLLGDWFLEGAGAGGYGATGNYFGLGTAYHNYYVYSKTTAFDAIRGGYYYGGGGYFGGYTAQFAVGNVSVTDYMVTDSYMGQTKSNTNSSNINNYYGRTLPPDGSPNSISCLYFNGALKQQRIYGPNGKAIVDIDYFHPGQNHNFPHVHFFDWSLEDPRGDAINLFS